MLKELIVIGTVLIIAIVTVKYLIKENALKDMLLLLGGCLLFGAAVVLAMKHIGTLLVVAVTLLFSVLAYDSLLRDDVFKSRPFFTLLVWGTDALLYWASYTFLTEGSVAAREILGNPSTTFQYGAHALAALWLLWCVFGATQGGQNENEFERGRMQAAKSFKEEE